MVAIIYSRVSTEDQARHGYSLPAQLAACRQKATACGAGQIIEVVDEGVSGEVLARPGLERARQMIAGGGISLFVCLDPDRLARKLSLQLLITEELDRAGVKLEFVNFDWKDSPEGRLFYSLRGAISEYEKEKIRERSARGKLQKAKQGLVTHDPRAYGYRYNKGHLEIEPHEAAVVRQMYEWYRGGDGFKTITDRLNEQGFLSPQGKTWQRGTVKRILKNPTYTGVIHLNQHDAAGAKTNRYLPKEQRRSRTIRPPEEWIEVPVPTIIDEVLFYAVQKRNEQARRMHSGYSVEFYLLSGMINCGVCGHTMHGTRTRMKSGKGYYRYYVCTAKSPGIPGLPLCGNPHHNADEVEGEVLSTLADWLSDINLWLKMLRQHLQVPATGEQHSHLEAELQAVKEQQGRLLDVVQRGMVDVSDVAGRMEKLRGQEVKLRLALTKEKQASPIPLPGLDELTDLARRNVAMLGGPPEERQLVVRHLVQEVAISPNVIDIIPRCNV